MSTTIVNETTTTDAVEAEVAETNSRIKGLFSKVGSATVKGAKSTKDVTVKGAKATKSGTVKATKATGRGIKVASVKVYHGSPSDIVDVTVDSTKAVATKVSNARKTVNQARQVRKMIKASIKESMIATK